MIAIIDYDAGNIKSVEKALAYLGEEVRITRDREEILASDGVILPGDVYKRQDRRLSESGRLCESDPYREWSAGI